MSQVCIAPLLLLSAAPLQVREWTDNTGTFKVTAAYDKCADGVVYLKRLDRDQPVPVPLTRLSTADLCFLAEHNPESLCTLMSDWETVAVGDPLRARRKWRTPARAVTGTAYRVRRGTVLVSLTIGGLTQLPFEDLVDEDKTFLRDTHPLLYAVSLAELTLRQQEREQQERKQREDEIRSQPVVLVLERVQFLPPAAGELLQFYLKFVAFDNDATERNKEERYSQSRCTKDVAYYNDAVFKGPGNRKFKVSFEPNAFHLNEFLKQQVTYNAVVLLSAEDFSRGFVEWKVGEALVRLRIESPGKQRVPTIPLPKGSNTDGCAYYLLYAAVAEKEQKIHEKVEDFTALFKSANTQGAQKTCFATACQHYDPRVTWEDAWKLADILFRKLADPKGQDSEISSRLQKELPALDREEWTRVLLGFARTYKEQLTVAAGSREVADHAERMARVGALLQGFLAAPGGTRNEEVMEGPPRPSAGEAATRPEGGRGNVQISGRLVSRDNRNQPVRNILVQCATGLADLFGTPRTYTKSDGTFLFRVPSGTDCSIWLDNRLKIWSGRLRDNVELGDIEWPR